VRFALTVVLAAILLFVAYVFIGAIVDGYLGGNMIPNGAVPDSWAAPNSWAEWRDIVLVWLGLWFAFAAFLLCVLLAALVFLVFTIRRLVKDNAAPAIDSLRGTLDQVKGTTEFVGESAVAPIVRVYSIVRGVRSGVSSLKAVPDRVKNRRKNKK
jgi:hypothetical protein